MDRYKWLSALLLGVVIGMACKEQISDTVGGSIIDTAHAQAASACDQWEARAQEIGEPIPAGWEPFGFEYCVGGYECLAVRRCVD